MAGDVRTNVVLSAETKGFDKALRQTLGINEAALKGLKEQAGSYKAVQKEIAGYQGKLDDLSKTQLKLSRSMEAMGDKGSEAYSALKDSLREVNREARDTERVVSNLEKAYRKEGEAVKTLGDAQKRVSDQQQQDTRQARGAFLQGAIQAGVPGMAPLFMQRGPGMRRQMLGMMAGGALRRGVGGLGAAAFGGVAGLQQAISAIPGGGLIAGQLGTAAGYAGQALGWQRQRVEMAPFIGGMRGAGEAGPSVGAIRAGAARAGTQARARLLRQTMERMGIEPEGARATELTRELAEDPALKTRMRAPAGETPQQRVARMRGTLAIQTMRESLEAEEARAAGEFEAEGMGRRVARRRAREAPFRQITRMGRRLRGLGRQEAAQEAAAIMQATGGVYRGGAEQQRFMGAAMAARTAFGVGPEVTGAFGMAARRGGLVGGAGRGAEAITEALTDAVRLGLEGSEINTYMQQVAAGIQQFQQTGIPFNEKSISAMAMELSKGGMAGTRAMRVAGGIQQYVQQIGARGPTGGLDLMMMQAFGGYRGGGGAAELERSFVQMEEMGTELKERGVGGVEAGGKMAGTMRRIMEMGGGGAGGRLFLRRQLGKMGVQVGAREMAVLGKRITGEALTETEQKWVTREGEARKAGAERAAKMGIETLPEMAARIVTDMGPNLAKQATILDKQLAVGESLLPTVQNLESSAANASTIFATLAGEPLANATKALEDFTTHLSKLTKESGIIEAIAGMSREYILGS